MDSARIYAICVFIYSYTKMIKYAFIHIFIYIYMIYMIYVLVIYIYTVIMFHALLIDPWVEHMPYRVSCFLTPTTTLNIE